jgi:uncharacterized protein
MAGESDLEKLLDRMEPALIEGKFYFATVDESQLLTLSGYLEGICSVFREKEGLGIVFSENLKDVMARLTDKEIVGPFALISLTVHSNLYSIGLLAKVTDALAKEGITVNAVSAYYHDHLFVPYERKEDAMAALAKI